MEKSGHLFGWDRDGDPTFEVYAVPSEMQDWLVNQIAARLKPTEVKGAKEVRVNMTKAALLALVHERWK